MMLGNMLLNYCFDTTVRTNAYTLAMDNLEGHGKGYGKSWSVKFFKEYKPCGGWPIVSPRL